MEKRQGALIDIDKSDLEKRIKMYYDSSIDWKKLESLNSGLTVNASRFDAKKARKKVISSEKYCAQNILLYVIRPFENRWCYYSMTRPLWNEPRPTLWKQCWEGNSFLLSRIKAAKSPEGSPFYFVNGLSDDHLLTPDASCFAVRIKAYKTDKDNSLNQTLTVFDIEQFIDSGITANLSEKSRKYLAIMDLRNPDDNRDEAYLIWYHVLAIGYSPQYLEENSDGIRQDFPRILLPNSKELLLHSALLGETIAKLLNTEEEVIGVTTKIRPELKNIAVISRVGGGQLNPDTDLALTVGWGHLSGNATMPGRGKIIETPDGKAYDIYLNDIAYWKNIPKPVWKYIIGGYQVIKKWLSYREEPLLGRPLKIEEVQEVTNMARRIAAIIALEPELNANYQAIKANTYPWYQD